MQIDLRGKLPRAIRSGLRVARMLQGGHRPYRSLSGGRGSGKTRSFAQLLVARSFQFRGGSIYATRAFQQSLRESSKPAIEWAIHNLGAESAFQVLDTEIRNRLSGVSFRFQGLERQRDSIRGWENVRIVWIGEGQHVTKPTAQILVPTVHRFPAAEIWLDWNPANATRLGARPIRGQPAARRPAPPHDLGGQPIFPAGPRTRAAGRTGRRPRGVRARLGGRAAAAVRRLPGVADQAVAPLP